MAFTHNSLTSLSSSSFHKTTSSKIPNVYEIDYISEDHKYPLSRYPIINPYHVYQKDKNPFRHRLRHIFGHPQSGIMSKDFVQASQFTTHPLPATTEEQYVTLHLPPEFPTKWRQEGYTHIHFGAIRISLTLHAKKGLPMVSRIALLDPRFPQYQYAVIGTVQTTLNASVVFITLFPNFTMSLADPSLQSVFRVQIQNNRTKTPKYPDGYLTPSNDLQNPESCFRSPFTFPLTEWRNCISFP